MEDTPKPSGSRQCTHANPADPLALPSSELRSPRLIESKDDSQEAGPSKPAKPQPLVDEIFEPQPGPSNKAAEFDLEVFDSGSSCSLEDGWALDHPEKGKERKSSHGNGRNRKCGKATCVAASVSRKVISSLRVEKESSAESKQPPASACPSDAEDDVVMDCSCPGLPQDDPREVVNRWKCSKSSNDGESGRGKAAVAAPAAADVDVDEIVQDHDTFGTDENEDSLDAMPLADASADEAVLSASNLVQEQTPTQSQGQSPLGLHDGLERESCLVVTTERTPLGASGMEAAAAAATGVSHKRKSASLLTLEEVGPSAVKRLCLEADEQQEFVSSALPAAPDMDDEDTMPSNDNFDNVVEISAAAARGRGMTDQLEMEVATTAGLAASPTPPSSAGGSCSAERSRLMPDKENPPADILAWVSTFSRWSPAERILAVDHLISACQPSQVRHMLAVIEPQFQRDFISFLPKELSLYVLSFLSPKDLTRAAQTCRYWRILCEDNLLWREKCREAGLEAEEFRQEMLERCLRRSHVLGFDYSTNKASFMRQHNIEMNWRVRGIRTPKVLKGHDDHVITCLQFNNNRIVSGSDDNTLKVWSAVTGKCLRTLIGHTGGVWSSQMEDHVIISGSTDRTLRVWNADTGACVHTLYGHTSTVRCMYLHKQHVVSGSRDATLRMWDIDTGECLHVLMGHVAAVRCVQYNGRLVVSGAYDYMVKVWNPEREECLHTLSGHTNRVYSLQFDGIHVVSGSLDTSIRVWDVETGACKHALMGHQSLTSGMELRNNILVSGNADSTVKVWDITSGQCLQTLSGVNKHQSAVTCLQFNSKFVITSSDDGTVKLWDVKTGDFIRDLVALESGGSGGVVWRIRANATKLVCAVGSRNGTEETKLLVLDFDAHEMALVVSKASTSSPLLALSGGGGPDSGPESVPGAEAEELEQS